MHVLIGQDRQEIAVPLEGIANLDLRSRAFTAKTAFGAIGLHQRDDEIVQATKLTFDLLT